MSYKKSNVTGRTWSTPFNTPFFIRWGEWNIKVPMENLREEYNAWEEMRRRPEPEPPKHESSRPFPSGPFNWAEDVEKELFSASGNDSDTANANLDSEPGADRVDCPTEDQVTPEGVVGVGAGTTPCAVPKVDEEEGTTREDKAGNPEPAVPAAATNVDNTVYRILNVSMTGNNLSIRMVEDANAEMGHSTTAQKLSEAIQFLAGAGLLHLDNYATVFEAVAARACASGNRFWLKDPRCGYEIVV